jgi:hypothetical protein
MKVFLPPFLNEIALVNTVQSRAHLLLLWRQVEVSRLLKQHVVRPTGKNM